MLLPILNPIQHLVGHYSLDTDVVHFSYTERQRGRKKPSFTSYFKICIFKNAIFHMVKTCACCSLHSVSVENFSPIVLRSGLKLIVRKMNESQNLTMLFI